MTQLQAAKKGIITDAMKQVAADENVAPEKICEGIALGHLVIPLNPNHKNVKAVGVGKLFKTKINANLGRSTTRPGKGDVLIKLEVALKAGADFVMDLSVGENVFDIRQGMLEASPAPLQT